MDNADLHKPVRVQDADPGAIGEGKGWFSRITKLFKIRNAADTGWDDVLGGAHTHPQSDVTNLVSDLALKAPLASPALTGTPTAPTAAGGTNTTQLATTAFVQGEIAPKAPLASPTFTGDPKAPTATIGDKDTSLATTAFVREAVAEFLLGKLTGADFNVTTDQAIAICSNNYRITRIVVKNASVSLTTAAGGIYTGAGKTGTTIVAAGQTYAALTAASKFLLLTLDTAPTTDLQTATQLFLSLTTAQGSAATADVYVYGERYD